MEPMNNILELQHIYKSFGSQNAVSDVNFCIPKGCVFGLLGPNGAGKTTLLRMITGIFFPDKGAIIFEGKPFQVMDHILQIGYMPEERGLYKKMKVGEQVLYLAQLKGLRERDARAKIRFWFRRFQIESWWDKKVGDLSKGMSQKVQFIATVVHEPQLLILDEPFSGLDPINANLIKDEIFELSRNGTTIIFSTHRMEQVEEICNQIILIDKGQKILDGSLKQIKQEFKQNLFKVEFNSSFSENAGLNSRNFRVVERTENSLVLQFPPGGRTNDALKELIEISPDIKLFQEILPSLNDIFIKQVERTDSTLNN